MAKYYKLGNPTPIENVKVRINGMFTTNGILLLDTNLEDCIHSEDYETIILVQKNNTGLDFFLASDQHTNQAEDSCSILYIGEWIES